MADKALGAGSQDSAKIRVEAWVLPSILHVDSAKLKLAEISCSIDLLKVLLSYRELFGESRAKVSTAKAGLRDLEATRFVSDLLHRDIPYV